MGPRDDGKPARSAWRAISRAGIGREGFRFVDARPDGGIEWLAKFRCLDLVPQRPVEACFDVFNATHDSASDSPASAASFLRPR